MSNADRMFEAAAELGRIIAEHRRQARQAAKDARNARRRARYAASPKTPKAAPAVLALDDEEYVPECRCHVVPMPPCTYCDSGAGDDDA